MKKLLFLDIDGVLNRHGFCPMAGSCGLLSPHVDRLNKVLWCSGAGVVVSSAWRYLVHNGIMSLDGLDWLLRSHGLHAGRLVGVTRRDTMLNGGPLANERGQQIADWRLANRHNGPYVVIDDLDLGITIAGHPFVRTDSHTGLTNVDVDMSLKLLRSP